MHRAGASIRTDTPVPRLATDEPFRYARNPGYLSLAMLYAGITPRRNALWAILFPPAVLFVVQREVIGREERYLDASSARSICALQSPGAALDLGRGNEPLK